MWENAISDISPLVGLTDLTLLDLRDNSILNITPLTGLTKLEYLSLEDNPIEDTSVLCPLLEQRPGLTVDIEIDCQPDTKPGDRSVSANTSLIHVHIGENQSDSIVT